MRKWLVLALIFVFSTPAYALKTIEPEPGVGTLSSHLGDINDNFVEHEADISGLTTGKESATSNDFDPDRLAGDTVDDNLLDVGVIAEIGADDVIVNTISGATYDDLNDYINTTGTAGFINGGMAISDDGDGSITVASGSGYIRISDSNTAQIRAFDIAETYVDLTDDALNYVYVYYNSGAPATAATTDLSSINHRDEFVIGIVYRDGTDLHISSAGQRLTCFKNSVYLHSWETDGLERASGLVTTHTGTRNLAITAGVLYLALNRTELPAFDSSGADSFTLVYSDGLGGWTQTTGQTQISNTLYDDGDGTPGNLTITRYRTDWVYILADGTVYVKLGTNNDVIANALAEEAPADLPNELQSPMAMLIAKIIIQQGASSFYEIHTPWDSTITPSVVTDHGNLGGLADDDHPQYGALAQDETIAGNWDNTANPWADNEVSDTITVGPSGSVDDAAIPSGITRDTELTDGSVDAVFGDMTADSISVTGSDGDRGWTTTANTNRTPGGSTYEMYADTAAGGWVYTDGNGVEERLGTRFKSMAVADLSDTTTPSVLTSRETTNTCISNYKSSGADHVFTMPAAHAAGNVIFQIGDEFQVDIEPNSSDNFYLNGTAMAADEHIQNTSDTLGTRIVGYCVNINGTMKWMFYSGDAEWVEETP